MIFYFRKEQSEKPEKDDSVLDDFIIYAMHHNIFANLSDDEEEKEQ